MSTKQKGIIIAIILAVVCLIAIIASILINRNSSDKVTHKFDDSNYQKYWYLNLEETVSVHKSLIDSTSAKLLDVLYTDHKIYLDDNNAPFIISGVTKVYLKDFGDNVYDIPDEYLNNLKSELKASQIIIYDNEDELKLAVASLPEGNITLNEGGGVDAYVEYMGSEPFIACNDVFDALVVKASQNGSMLDISYNTIGGTELSFSLPIDKNKKGKTFTEEGFGVFYCPYINKDNEYMIHPDIIKHLLGFDISCEDEKAKSDKFSIISDYADIVLRVVKNPVTLDFSQYADKTEDGVWIDEVKAPEEVKKGYDSQSGDITENSGKASQKQSTSSKKSNSSSESTATSKTTSSSSSRSDSSSGTSSDSSSSSVIPNSREQSPTVVSTCVGDVEISGTPEECALQVVEAFKAAHPDWAVTYMASNSSFKVEYKFADANGTLADAISFCNSNPDNIANMSQEQLYTLSSYLRSTSSASYNYRAALNIAWAEKMTFQYTIPN